MDNWDNEELTKFLQWIMISMWDAIGAIYVNERSDAARILIETIQKIEQNI